MLASHRIRAHSDYLVHQRATHTIKLQRVLARAIASVDRGLVRDYFAAPDEWDPAMCLISIQLHCLQFKIRDLLELVCVAHS